MPIKPGRHPVDRPGAWDQIFPEHRGAPRAEVSVGCADAAATILFSEFGNPACRDMEAPVSIKTDLDS